jgi:sugar lactone lactonase YvrE
MVVKTVYLNSTGVLPNDKALGAEIDKNDNFECDQATVLTSKDYTVQVDDELILRDYNDNVIFQGLVSSSKIIESAYREIIANTFEIQLINDKVEDNFENYNIIDLIEELVLDYSDMTFSSDYVSAIIIPVYRSRNKSPWDIIQDLMKRLTDATYNISNKNFHLYVKGSQMCSVTLDNYVNCVIEGWEENDEDQATSLKLTGAKFDETKTELFSGTGAQTNFTLANVPKVTGVLVGGVEKNLTIDGQIDGDYTINKITKEIIFAVAPALGTYNITVNYTFENNINIDYTAEPSILAKHGRKRLTITRKWLDNYDDAIDYAIEYINVNQLPSLSTTAEYFKDLDLTKFTPGNSIRVKDSYYDFDGAPINAEFLISGVKYNYPDSGIMIKIGGTQRKLSYYLKEQEYNLKQLYEEEDNSSVFQYAETINNNVSIVSTEELTALQRDLPDDYMYFADAVDPYVAWFKLNGNALDLKDDDRSIYGTWTGTPSYVTGHHFPQCADFNGSSYITLNNEDNFDIVVGEMKTYSFWVYPRNVTSIQYLYSKYNGNATGHSEISMSPSGKVVATFRSTATNNPLTSNTSLQINTWHHILVTYNSVSGATQIYINGNFDKSNTQATDILTNTVSPKIGIRATSLLSNFDGKIEDFRFYNRIPSTEEIAALYMAGAGSCSACKNWLIGNGEDRYFKKAGDSDEYYITSKSDWNTDATAEVNTKLQTYIKGDNSVDDEGINSYTTTNSGATFTAGHQFDTAMDFDGVDDYVEIADGKPIVSTSVSSQTSDPSGVTFKDDGLKMYVSDNANNRVHQYDLSTAWDITSKTYIGYVDVSGQDTSPRGVFFKPDGTTMYLVGDTNDTIYQYTLSTAWLVSSATYASKSFSVAAKDTGVTTMFIKSDGTKWWFGGTVGDKIYQYSMGTPWDISTSSYQKDTVGAIIEQNIYGFHFNSTGDVVIFGGNSSDSIRVGFLETPWEIDTFYFSYQTIYIGNYDTSMTGLYVRPDGLQVFFSGTTGDSVYSFELYEPWSFANPSYGTDINKELVYRERYVYSAQTTNSRGLDFSSDYTKFYIISSTDDTVYQYSMTTAGDVRTASYASKSLSITTNSPDPQDIKFKSDGTKFYIADNNTNYINQYTLGTAWDISTGSYDSKRVQSPDSTPVGIAFKPDGTKLYIVGSTSDIIYEYNVATPWDVSTATNSGNSFVLGLEIGSPRTISFKSDGTIMFLSNGSDFGITKYTLSTPWDITTCVVDPVSFNARRIESSLEGMHVKSDGTTIYLAGSDSDAVSKIKLNNAWAFEPTTGNGFSGSVWFNARTLGESGRIINKSMGGATSINTSCSFELLTIATDTLRIRIGDNSNTLATGLLTYNTWNWLFFRCDSNGFVRMYLNNVEILSAYMNQPSMINAIENTRIGNISNLTSGTFDGKIADVQLYNYLVTDEEKDRIWNSGNGITQVYGYKSWYLQ